MVPSWLIRMLDDGSTRCELMFTAPFALVAGALFGWEAAPRLGLPPFASAGVCAGALLAFVTFQVALEPAVVHRFAGARGAWAPAVAWLWDSLTGALVGWPVLAALGTPPLPAAGLAATAGAAYGWLMGAVVCGEGPRALAGLLTGSLGGTTHRGHSHARALETRGELARALEVYREAVDQDARDAEAWLGLARLTLRHGGDAEAAVRLLREARDRARLDEEQEALLVRKIAQAREAQGRPEAAAPDLARYLEDHPEGAGARWARARLRSLKERIREETGGGPHAPPADGHREEEGVAAPELRLPEQEG